MPPFPSAHLDGNPWSGHVRGPLNAPGTSLLPLGPAVCSPTMPQAAASLPHTLLYQLSQVLTGTPSSTPAPRILTDCGACQAPYNPALPHSRPCRQNSYLMTSLSPLLAPKALLFLGLPLCGWPSRLETCGANHFQDSSCGPRVSYTPCLSPTRARLLGGEREWSPTVALLFAPSSFPICSMLLRGSPQALEPGCVSVCTDAP